jgi:hypothetical protein
MEKKKEKDNAGFGFWWKVILILLFLSGVFSLALFYFIPFMLIQNTSLIPLDKLKAFFFNSSGNDNSFPQSNAEIIGSLGTVGDWFGGTTLPILTFLSYLGVVIAIIMQRQELGLQRKELRETRDVFIIQRFENTFFNMINLHHDITKDIVIEETKGRAVMKEILEKLKHTYNNAIYVKYTTNLKHEAMQGDKVILDDLIKKEFFNSYLREYIDNIEPHLINFNGDNGEPDSSEYVRFHESLNMGTNKKWNEQSVKLTEKYEKEVYMNDDSYATWLKDLSFRDLPQLPSTAYTDKFIHEFINEPLKELKVAAIEEAYNYYEDQIGHYFRNLYRIIKLIHDEKFHEIEEDNNKAKQKYRGILRAQLSSYELLVIFYNIVYSSKGKKFKNILKNTHFFEDHLSNFIWSNDNFELEQMDKT